MAAELPFLAAAGAFALAAAWLAQRLQGEPGLPAPAAGLALGLGAYGTQLLALTGLDGAPGALPPLLLALGLWLAGAWLFVRAQGHRLLRWGAGAALATLGLGAQGLLGPPLPAGATLAAWAGAAAALSAAALRWSPHTAGGLHGWTAVLPAGAGLWLLAVAGAGAGPGAGAPADAPAATLALELAAAAALGCLYLALLLALQRRGLSFGLLLAAIAAVEVGIMYALPLVVPALVPASLEPLLDGALLSLFLLPLLRREQRLARDLRRSSELQRAINRLLTLEAQGELPLEALLRRALDVILGLSWLSVQPRGGIFLADAQGLLHLRAHRGLDPAVRRGCATVRPGHCLCGLAAARRQLLHKAGLDHEHSFRPPGMADHGHYNVPLLRGEELMGVLLLYLPVGHPYREWEAEALRSLAEVLAGLIHAHRQREQQRLLQQAVEQGRQGVLITDARQRILYVNRFFTEVTGYAPEEVLGRNPSLLSSGRHEEAFYRSMWRRIRQEGRWEGEIWNRRKDGSVYPEWLSISAIRSPAGAITHYVGVFTDLSEVRAAQEEIRHLAFHDTLTGLANRSWFHEQLERALSRARRREERVALLFIDMDRFKGINDTLGHAVGDEVLREIGRRLRQSLRREDLVARLGGDEFVVLLSGSGREEVVRQARAAARKLLRVLEEPIRVGRHTFHLSASIGIALYPDDAATAEQLLQYADATMYQSKRAERGRFRFFSRRVNEGLQRRAAVEEALRRAIGGGELALHYQPKVRLADGALAGAEALLRWTSPRLGRVSPAEFIPVAEETGLILEVGLWALEAACRQKRQWLDRGLCTDVQGAHIAVNVAPRQIQAPGFVRHAIELLERYRLGPGEIQLELTETGLMRHHEAVVRSLAELKEAGYTLAVDDFGTGYSSLARLRDFPIDLLKIDRSFVADLSVDPEDAAIVRAVIDMGRALGIPVCAEGVETAEQVAFLRRHGCLYGQGFLFGHPMPAPALEEAIRRWDPARACPPQRAAAPTA
ncbi:MAG: EAL domain-containing protein [Gammaproteobacteria bacterium]|nr:MAG: EAL domain-containing protein [Gammaproteobacteria bacterium]